MRQAELNVKLLRHKATKVAGLATKVALQYGGSATPLHSVTGERVGTTVGIGVGTSGLQLLHKTGQELANADARHRLWSLQSVMSSGSPLQVPVGDEVGSDPLGGAVG